MVLPISCTSMVPQEYIAALQFHHVHSKNASDKLQEKIKNMKENLFFSASPHHASDKITNFGSTLHPYRHQSKGPAAMIQEFQHFVPLPIFSETLIFLLYKEPFTPLKRTSDSHLKKPSKYHLQTLLKQTTNLLKLCIFYSQNFWSSFP